MIHSASNTLHNSEGLCTPRKDNLRNRKTLRAPSPVYQVQPRSAHKSTPTPKKRPKQYEVEAILADQQGKQGREYFIKWKGYPDSENSWEPHTR